MNLMSPPAQEELLPPAAARALAALVDTSADAFVVIDAGGTVVHLNRAASELTGWPVADAGGLAWQHVVDLLHGDPRDGGRGNFDAPLAGMHRVALRARDGTVRRALLRFETSEHGTLLTLRPHDALAALEHALDESERRLAVALEGGQVGLWEWEVATDTLVESGYWVGRTAHTAHAAPGNERCGADLMQHTHPDDVDSVREGLRAHLDGLTPHYEVEQRVRLTDGGYVRFLVRGQVAERDELGRPLRVIGTYTDVTMLRENERRLTIALESSQQGIWEWHIATNQLTEHHEWRPQLNEYNIPTPIDSATLLRYVAPDDIPRIEQAIVAHLRGESSLFETELRLRRVDGSYGNFLLRGRAPERDADGRCERMLGTYTEITALKANERILELALENGRQALWIWEPELDRVRYSRELYGMLGLPQNAFTSHREAMAALLHPDDHAPGRAALLPLLRGARDDFQIEHRFRHRDGHYLYILSRGRVLERGDNGRARRIVGTHVDITALKGTEQRLYESRRLLETVIEAFPLRVFWKDRDSRYLGCNGPFARAIGRASPADVIGLNDDDLPWRDVAESIRDDDRHVIDGTRARITTERLIAIDGGQTMWVETTKVPIRDSDGTIRGLLGFFDDITRRRAREQQLRVIANALTSGTQVRLLNAVTRAAAELAEADFAFISRVNPDNTATVSACYPVSDEFLGLHYSLHGTPCAAAVAQTGCFIAADAARRYPDDAMLARHGIEGYVGQPLIASGGEVIGLFTLMFTQPVAVADRVRPVIDIFAARAISELERERTVAELEASEQRLNAAIEGANQGLWEWNIQSEP